MKAEEIRIPTKEERVHVSKETVVKEDVNVSKQRCVALRRSPRRCAGRRVGGRVKRRSQGVRQTNKEAGKK